MGRVETAATDLAGFVAGRRSERGAYAHDRRPPETDVEAIVESAW